jgi:hypothetical protein
MAKMSRVYILEIFFFDRTEPSYLLFSRKKYARREYRRALNCNRERIHWVRLYKQISIK